MQELKNLQFKWPKILKIAGFVLVVIILLAIFVNLIVAPFFSGLGVKTANKTASGISSYSLSAPTADFSYQYDVDEASLSMRNVRQEAALGGGSSAEDYEVTQYNATIETGKLEDDCAVIAALKSKDYIIFENSNIAEQYCNFSFKIEKDKAEEVLAVINDLDPRDLNQNIQTIQKQIEDFTSREEILKSKQASIDDTLKSVLAAYDEITDLARKTNNADSLAQVIDSKIRILEKLTAQRLQISAELESLARAKAEQLDRLNYVEFYVYIYENKIVDGQTLKDFWIASAKRFVSNINQLLKDLSLGLVEILLLIVKYFIYIFLVVIAAKLCWKLGKKIWKK